MMNTQPLVTISVPLFKCENFLEKCLDSIRVQTYPNIEVTLINDQTPDSSVVIAEEYIAKYNLDNWRIYHLDKNSGLSVVRNKGIETATGKYLFFLDSDDVITTDCIEKLVKISEKTGAEMSIAQLECEQLETGKRSICIKIESEKKIITGNAQILADFADGQLVTYAVNKLFLVNFIRNNHIYFVPGLFAQDELWTFHLVLKLNKIAICKDITYTYFLHSRSVIHNRNKRNFDNWFTIGQHVDTALRKENNEERKKLILKYLIHYKATTLLMNWKAQKNSELWKESYRNYKKLSALPWYGYFSGDYSLALKKTDFFNSLPTALGYRLFRWRYER